MLVGLGRGLMLLISASPTSSGFLVRSSPSVPLSSLCRHTSWQQLQQYPFRFAGRTVPSRATQQSSLWPILGFNSWLVNSRRIFHEPPPPATERERLAGFDEGFGPEYLRAAEKKLGWNQTPVFEFSGPPNWRERNQRSQRNRRESVGSGHGNIWERERGGRGISSRASSNTTGGATVKGIKRQNGDKRGPGSKQRLENLKVSASNGAFFELEGNGRRSQAEDRPAPPPFKPTANYFEKLAQSRGGEGDGKSPGASGRPPFKATANYNESPPQSREGGDSHGKRVPSQESRALGQETFLDSSSLRNAFNSNQNSPEEKEKVVRKYPYHLLPRRLEGEKKWQYAVRKKQLGLAGRTRGSKKKVGPEWVDDANLGNEPQGDDWRRKKTAWLCKEIPRLRPRPIITILNEQRKWIKAEDAKYIVDHLLQIGQTLRAHRVLKWEMQQPWYEFDYELSSKVAVQLGQMNKLNRTRDIYDFIIKNGKVPNLATYEVIITCYIADGEDPALAKAWSLYNEMSELGGHEPPPTLSYNLFQGLIEKGLTFLDEADDLFKHIKTSGLPCSTKMYSLLIHSHGAKGNRDRVEDLIKEMNETGLPVGQDVYAAILISCAKDGNVAVGEQAFFYLKLNGHKPTPSVFSSLIKMYGKAGLSEKAFQTFEEMRETGTRPNLTVYQSMIEVAVLSGNRDQAEKLLKEAQERGTPSLHACYNSVMELYSHNGLLDESEKLFNEMKLKGYPPNQLSFNVLLEAYVRHRLLDKGEAVYENMKRSERVKPNKKTYELMIQLYGEAKSSEKLKEVFKVLADKKLDMPKEANRYLEAAVNPKHLASHRNAQLKLKREEREIVAGVLLAGAGVETHDKNRTYELHFGLDPDSEVGLPLINHLYKQFSAWSTETPKRRPLSDSRKPKRSKMLLAFQTVSHGSFRFFAHQYRPNQSPVIPRLIHRWLTPRALAYWYMYGGTRCPETGDILLNASVYSDKEIMLVVNALKSRTIHCEKKRTGIGMAICVNGRSAIWLWGLMEPHILPEVKGLLKPEDDQGEQDLCSNFEQVFG